MVRVAIPRSWAARRLSPRVCLSVSVITRSSISSSGVPTSMVSARVLVDGMPAAARAAPPRSSREVVDVDERALREHHRALDGVLELAHVAGPVVGAHHVDGGAREALHGLVVLLAEAREEVLGEERDV